MQEYLAGMEFPAKKIDLIRHARDKGAPDEIISALEMLSESETFENPTEVSETLEDTALDVPGNATETEEEDEEAEGEEEETV